MKPIKFKEANCTYAENQPEYLPLPVFKDTGKDGSVISCWQLSFKERIRILIKGSLWLSIMTFNKPLQPLYLTTKKSEVLIDTDKIVKKNTNLFLRLRKKYNYERQ